jgi:F-type H+-transporting ATPase subunit a
MQEVQRHVLITLPKILGIDLSITNEVILVWAAAITTFLLLATACRRRTLVARGAFRNFFEALVELIDKEAIRANLGSRNTVLAPFLLTLFFFILFLNLMGMLPFPNHVKSMTSNLNVTISLALIVFVTTFAVDIKHNGLRGFACKFMPSDVPRPIAVFIIPIEIISWLVRPLSLAIRLFANMLAGHALILTFIGLIAAAATSSLFLVPLPLAAAVAMSSFELFVCFIQAFVFTLLAGMYLKEATEEYP